MTGAAFIAVFAPLVMACCGKHTAWRVGTFLCFATAYCLALPIYAIIEVHIVDNGRLYSGSGFAGALTGPMLLHILAALGFTLSAVAGTRDWDDPGRAQKIINVGAVMVLVGLGLSGLLFAFTGKWKFFGNWGVSFDIDPEGNYLSLDYDIPGLCQLAEGDIWRKDLPRNERRTCVEEAVRQRVDSFSMAITIMAWPQAGLVIIILGGVALFIVGKILACFCKNATQSGVADRVWKDEDGRAVKTDYDVHYGCIDWGPKYR
jgi:hypothetical protein